MLKMNDAMRKAIEGYKPPEVSTERQAIDRILEYSAIDTYSSAEAAEKLGIAAQDYFRLKPQSQGVELEPITNSADIKKLYIDRSPQTTELQTAPTKGLKYDFIQKRVSGRMR